MAKVSINIIKEWFKNQMKPPQEQFWAWLDSFWHKDDLIPTASIEGLDGKLQKKADLVDGVVPESQLPFSVVTSEVISLGKVSVTGNKTDLEVHSSGENKVRVKGQLITRTFPNQWTITPIVADGTKVLRGYAVKNESDFFLAEGPELPNIEDPEIPPEALEIFKITLNAAGSTVTVPTTGYQLKKEDGWRTTLVGSTIDPIKLNYAYDERGSFYVTKLPGTLGNVTIGGIRKSGMPENSIYDGRELLIYNATGEDLFIDSAGVDGSDSFLFSNKLTPLTVKNNSSIRVKRKDGILKLLPSGGGGATLPPGTNGHIYEIDNSLPEKIKPTNRLGTAETKITELGKQVIKSIPANTILDDTYHNCIVRITASCSVTVPTGLRADFNCVFDAIGIITVIFIADTGVTISSPFGLYLRDNLMATLYKTSSGNFRLNGGLTAV